MDKRWRSGIAVVVGSDRPFMPYVEMAEPPGWRVTFGGPFATREAAQAHLDAACSTLDASDGFDDIENSVARWQKDGAEHAKAAPADVKAHTAHLAGDELTDRLAARLDRDPAIEQAKTLLADRYMISRGEAFMILRETSQRTHTKLGDIARKVLSTYGD